MRKRGMAKPRRRIHSRHLRGSGKRASNSISRKHHNIAHNSASAIACARAPRAARTARGALRAKNASAYGGKARCAHGGLRAS